MARKRIFFIANAVWGDLVGGGDIHFFELARGAVAAGYEVFFFGGPALQKHVATAELPVTVILTEKQRRPRINEGSLSGQWQMFLDYLERCWRSLRLLDRIQPDDVVYSVTDYWCDSIPALLSRAHSQLMVFHMEAPTLQQILKKSRPDVQAGRLASLHYWLSQNFSLRCLQTCSSKHLFYLHPDMLPRLQQLGYARSEVSLISFGVDSRLAGSVEQGSKLYDVCWIGRVHRQKGIEDLVDTLSALAKTIPGFRALLMGKVEAAIRPMIEQRGLVSKVEFSGFVSEIDKFRLFKASRLFLMPSRHEGSPRVVGEALVCGVPVLAYDLPTYRPVFGQWVQYVPAFDLPAFQREAAALVNQSRNGKTYLDALDLGAFRDSNSWEATRARFLTHC